MVSLFRTFTPETDVYNLFTIVLVTYLLMEIMSCFEFLSTHQCKNVQESHGSKKQTVLRRTHYEKVSEP